MSALKNTSDLVLALLGSIEERVNAALANPELDKDGKVIPPKMKDLRDSLALEHGAEDSFVYALLSTYIDHRDDVTVKLGRDGGIVPRDAEEARKETAQQKRVSRMQKAAERGAKAAEKLAKLGITPKPATTETQETEQPVEQPANG